MGRLFNISKHSMGCERTYVVLLSSQKLQGIFQLLSNFSITFENIGRQNVD